MYVKKICAIQCNGKINLLVQQACSQRAAYALHGNFSKITQSAHRGSPQKPAYSEHSIATCIIRVCIQFQWWVM